jgi:hypothetical protein
MMTDEELSAAYEDAWADWADSGEAETWEAAVADGLASTLSR